jgi:3-deoxy-manno-octulosonate cytidylyltransferase (CMP-KDO synthetase)
MSKPICVIPGRMASSRFPGKPLVPLLGLPLILHVYERCKLYGEFADILVATCDEEIKQAVEQYGGKAVMTANTHERATDRVQEAIEKTYPDLEDDQLIIMVQGDELLVSPDMISGIVASQQKTNAPVVNLGTPIRAEDHDDPNTVKIVAAPDGRILYLSRAPIPSSSRAEKIPLYQQTGIMAFRYDFLAKFAQLPQTPLEIIESVDMLRVIEHGFTLHVVLSETETLGVDVPGDQAKGEKLLATDPHTHTYLRHTE